MEVTALARLTQQLQDCPREHMNGEQCHPHCWCKLLAVLNLLTLGQSWCTQGSASHLVGLCTQLLWQGTELAGPACAPCSRSSRLYPPPTVPTVPGTLSKAPRGGGLVLGQTMGPLAPLTACQAMWASVWQE